MLRIIQSVIIGVVLVTAMSSVAVAIGDVSEKSKKAVGDVSEKTRKAIDDPDNKTRKTTAPEVIVPTPAKPGYGTPAYK